MPFSRPSLPRLGPSARSSFLAGGLALLGAGQLACTGDKAGDTSVPATLTASFVLSEVIPTVPTVTWTLDGATPTKAWVEWGVAAPDEVPVAVDLSGAGPSYATSVLGMRPESDYQVRVRVLTDAGELVSETMSITTGYSTADMGTLYVENLDPSQATGGYLVSSQIASPPIALILDREGNTVWWYEPADVPMLSRTVVSKDGKSVLMGMMNLEEAQESDIIRVSLDGTQEERIRLDYRHHDFVELDDGTIGYLAYDPRTIDGELVPGDRIMEYHPDGSIVEIYNVWDHHEFEPSMTESAGWPHANALDYDPDTDSWLVSFMTIDTIAKVSRATGEEEWVLGGADSTMHDGDGSSDFFDGQHGMQMLDDSLLVFVNGPGNRQESRVVEMALDPGAGFAEEVWVYQPNPPLACPVLGDVHRFPTGNTLVTFSFNGAVHELGPDDARIWEMYTAIGGTLSYMTWMDHLQDPGI